MTALSHEKSFVNWSDYDDFLSLLESSADWLFIDNFRSSTVDVGLEKKYFMCTGNNETWELTEPDPPFRGSWKKANG